MEIKSLPLAKLRGYETPFYYYDMQLLRRTLDTIKRCAAHRAFHVHYAVKANPDSTILRAVNESGFGFDAVSGNEVSACLSVGASAKDVVYSGVGKTDRELEYGIRAGIGCFNIESVQEVEVISEIASRIGIPANVAIRVNPDIDAHTHKYITTGLAENKFGISLKMLDSVIEKCTSLPSLNFKGLHFHIGSQITSAEPYELLCKKINDLQDNYESRGIKFETINVGGGFGINYDEPDANPMPDFKNYFGTFERYLDIRPSQQVHFELGRSVVGQCGSLISRVLFVKPGESKKFVIIDAGMTDLIRPALYGAHHKIENLSSDLPFERYEVVGPICESSDVFGEDEILNRVGRGDVLAIRSAGAYGQAMAFRYNLRDLPKSVYSDDIV